MGRLELYKCVRKLQQGKLIADLCISNTGGALKCSAKLLIGEQYKLKGIAQAERIRHNRDL